MTCRMTSYDVIWKKRFSRFSPSIRIRGQWIGYRWNRLWMTFSMMPKTIQSDVIEQRKSTKTGKITVFATFAASFSIRSWYILDRSTLIFNKGIKTYYQAKGIFIRRKKHIKVYMDWFMVYISYNRIINVYLSLILFHCFWCNFFSVLHYIWCRFRICCQKLRMFTFLGRKLTFLCRFFVFLNIKGIKWMIYDIVLLLKINVR